MVMLGTPELVKLLGAKVYWEAMYSVIPIVAGGYLVFLYSLPASVEYYHAKTGFIGVGTGAAAVINIVLNFIFISRFGYLAAAYTTLAAYFLYFIFHYIIAWHIQKKVLFDTARLSLYIIIILVSGAVSLLLIPYWPIRWVMLAATGLAGVFWLEREFDIIRRIKEKLAGR